MHQIGTVSELWRYPVSSITGEKLDRAEMTVDGIVGDRLYALVETTTRIVAHPERDERWRKAIFLQSRTTPAGMVEIHVPDAGWIPVASQNLPEVLTRFFGFDAEVRSYQRSGLASPGGLFADQRYDVSPLHMLTSASVSHLEALHPGGNADRRRFRPNVYVETAAEIAGFVELDWVGQAITFGSVSGKIIDPTKRCGFTIIAQEGLAHDPEILRNIMRHGRKNMGVYCRTAEAGMVGVGDPVRLGD